MEMHLTEQQPPISSVKLAMGIFFTIFGLLLTLENLGHEGASRALAYWPVILIVVGILKLQQNGSRGVALGSIGVGTLMIAAKANLFRISIFSLWPVVLIFIGFGIVLRSLGVALPETGLTGGRTIWSVLTTRKMTIDSRDLHGRRLITFMGATEIELADDGTEPAEPVIVEVLAMWGGVEIKVPDGWDVIGEVTPIMGGADFKSNASRAGRQLIVRGLIWMAGMEVKNK